MKSDRVVVNASPLIVLFKADLAHLLPRVFTEVLVPGAVWDEVIAGGATDMAAQGLATIDWAKRVEVATVDPVILAWNLGQRESEVLSVALNQSVYRAVIDDAAARRCARTIQVPMLGTGGVLVLAKRRGLIPSVESSLQQLREAGLWLSDDIVALLVQQAGERDRKGSRKIGDRSNAYRKLYKQSNAAHPLGNIVGADCNSFPYFTAISKKYLA